jgi:two-component system, NarL family, sensor histidine kinase UhpB
MSLRFRLIGLIAIVLAVSLAIDGTIVFFNASRSVQTEMRSALQVGEQIVKSALKLLPEVTDRRRGLEELVAAFNGNRHLRVSLTGREIVSVKPSLEGPHFGTVASWFAMLLNIAPMSARFPVEIAGHDYGAIVIEADPRNEVLEVWNSLF